MAARQTPSKGGKPDKLMRDALLISLKREAGKGKTKKLQQVADALVDAAADGDIPAIKEIFDRIDGKAVQPVSGPDGGDIPVGIKVTFVSPGGS